MSQWVSDKIVAVNAQTVNQTAAVSSKWFDCSNAWLVGVWTTAASATGTCSVDTNVYLSPLDAKTLQALDDASSIGTQHYVKTKLSGSVLATDNLLTFYAVPQATYGPFRSMKVDVDGDGSNPADTVASVFVTRLE